MCQPKLYFPFNFFLLNFKEYFDRLSPNSQVQLYRHETVITTSPLYQFDLRSDISAYKGD